MAHLTDPKFQDILKSLTLEEKVKLLSGTPNDFVSTPGIPDKGISPFKTADSINGIRPSEFHGNLTTACFPNTACIASTWDVELLEKMGSELTRQARMKHAQMILGPTINIQRDPRAGRNFECFSEDPLLSGYMGAAIVRGIQNQGFGACAKHFVCNDSETMRRYYNVDESPYNRTLREIYLAAWSLLLKKSNPTGVMTAYNKVNGDFCCDSSTLIEDILRKEWGFKGVVLSDWFGTRSTVAAMNAGVDLEMPVPVFRGPKLVEAVRSGQVSEQTIDNSVLRLLDLRSRTQAAFSQGPEKSEIVNETNQVAQQLAHEGIVLLKNERDALPLQMSDSLKVAVIGEYAENPVFTGGGSASSKPQYRQIPVDLLRKAHPKPDNIIHVPGVRVRRVIPVAPTEILKTKDGHKGVEVSYFNGDAKKPFLTETSEAPVVFMVGNYKPGLQVDDSHIEMSTTLAPETTGTHTLALRHSGALSLKVDGVEVLTKTTPEITTEQFLFNLFKIESRIDLFMKAGKSYDVHVTMQSRQPAPGEPTPYGLTLGFEEMYSEEDMISEAVKAARASDVSVIYAGRSEQYESEGFDMDEITLPANQVAMIKAVAAASNRTVVLLHCGSPIDISSFVDDVDTIINMHFPGQEGPQAMVDILIGKTNPSGRLSATWFKTLKDWPSFDHFHPAKYGGADHMVRYPEGLAIGYRAAVPVERVQYLFGHGLSYTSFSYDSLHVNVDNSTDTPSLKVEVRVTNTGSRPGKEVVQLYIAPPEDVYDWRPQRELKEFTKIFLSPGESKVVKIELDVRDACSHWSQSSRAWIVDRGTYGIDLG
ncbi:hypothetical protein HG530_012616 [Fusarium avenaceum]|nr:hypothetical protein HG530_012616 [Fusarium avenaceum]